jgi:hypothetical protein
LPAQGPRQDKMEPDKTTTTKNKARQNKTQRAKKSTKKQDVKKIQKTQKPKCPQSRNTEYIYKACGFILNRMFRY